MNIKKIGGSFAVAISMLAFNAVAQADCTVESAEIKLQADWLLCAKDGGKETQAIWQFKGTKGDGCEVHKKLAKQLYVPHDEPPLGRGKGKGNNIAQGAANSLDDEKYEDALMHLQTFIDTIRESAKLNPKNPDAASDADWWATWAQGMKGRIEGTAVAQGCMPTP